MVRIITLLILCLFVGGGSVIVGDNGRCTNGVYPCPQPNLYTSSTAEDKIDGNLRLRVWQVPKDKSLPTFVATTITTVLQDGTVHTSLDLSQYNSTTGRLVHERD